MKLSHKTIAGITGRDPAGHRTAVMLDPAGKIISLHKDQYLRIEDVTGLTIRAFAGTAWLTQDGDTRDVVLEAGQSFTPERAGGVLLSALGEARLCLVHDDACPSAFA